MLKINEIFYSIQGESLSAGLPCVFIRLTGCNLRCSYCDTTYAYEQGEDMEIAEILDRAAEFNCRNIAVTGGEPLLQEETPVLIQRLIESGYTVLLETNGSMDISRVDPRCIKVVDIKCPGSNEQEKNNFDNLKYFQPYDQIKFVIGSHEDYLFAKKIIESVCSDIYEWNALFSPVHGKIDPAELAQWILDDHLNVRLHLQLHKIIWNNTEKK